MTKTILLTILIAGVFIVGSLATNEAFAAVDMFIKIDGVDGEATADGKRNQIDVDSWSWGETNSVARAGGGGGAGKVSMQDFHFTAKLNKSSPKLMEACANGQFFKNAELTLRRAGQPSDYLTIKLTDIIISKYQTGSEGDNPVDQVSLNFAKIEFEYIPQSDVGTPSGDTVKGSASKHGRA